MHLNWSSIQLLNFHLITIISLITWLENTEGKHSGNPVHSFKMLESFSRNLFIMYTDIQMAHYKFPKKQRYMQITLNHIYRLSRSIIHVRQWQLTVSTDYKNWTCALKLGEKNSKIKNLLSVGKWIFNMLQLLIKQWKLKLNILAKRQNREWVRWWWDPKVSKIKIIWVSNKDNTAT